MDKVLDLRRFNNSPRVTPFKADPRFRSRLC